MGMSDYPKPEPGKSLEQSGTARQWQNVFDACELIENLVAQWPLRVTRSHGSMVLALASAKEIVAGAVTSGVAVQQYTFFSQDWDYYRAYDKTVSPWVQVKIAKPFLLRPSLNAIRAQVHYNYQASSPHLRTGNLMAGETILTTEDQQIIPQYVRDDVVYAATLPKKVIGQVKNSNGVEQDDVALLDMNVDGRAWAAIYST